MAKLRNLFVKISFGLVLLGGLFFGPTHAPSVVYAQNTAPVLGGQAAPAVSGTNQIQPGDTGLQTIQQTSGLGSTPFTVIIANIIRIFLSLMGVIVIGVIIYGGFTYMTAGGSEETAEKAKRILTNGVIGLVIVLSSFGISEFIIRSFLTATGSPLANGGGGTTDVGIGGGTGLGGGGGSGFGALTVNFGSPRGLQKFANIRVNVVFNQAVDESTVSYGSNFIVTNKAGTKVDGAVTVDADTITFIPSKSCPAPNDSLHCFDPDEYNVSLVGGLSTSIHAAVTGKILVCTGVNCKFTFTAGTDIDTTAPNISNTTPPDNGKIPSESFVPVKALLSDNDGIAYGRILVDGKLLETVQPVYPAGNTGQQLYIISQKFNTKGDAPGTAHVIEVDAMDVAGNLGKAQIHTTSYAAHCFNKVQSVNGVTDPTEIAIDCSAANGECGLCANSACTASSQCAGGNGFCDPVKHVCSSSPIIKDVQPQDGAPGSYITISGDGFGTNFGSVTFLGDPKTDTDDVEAPLACDAGWSNDQVVVRVPDGAKSGAIQIKNSATSIDTTDNQTGLYLQQFKITDVVRPGICGLIPDSGFSGTKVSLLGTDDISSPSVDRKLFFGGYSANDATWAQITPNTITATLPDMDPGFINVQAVIKGITTNPLEFLVTASSTATTGKGPANPDNVLSLNSVAPAAGGVGTYVTLTGTGFGTVPNKVYFVVLDGSGNPTDQQVVADTNFPAQCAAGFWGNKQIIVKVPNIPVAKYGIRVYPYGNKTGSNIQNFTVNTDKPGPQVCAIKADNGPANGSLVISFFGEHFGTTPGVAIFSDHVVGLAPKTGSIWTDGKVNIMVPASAVSGGVRLSLVINGKATKNICDTNPSTCSNSVYFAVSDCRVVAGACKTGNICCADGSCGTSCISASKKVSAAFLWCFSTGDSCAVSQPPEIKEECNTLATATNSIPSPSPSSVWPSTVSACNNAQIAIKFTENIDPKTVNVFSGSKSSIIVEKCTGDISDPCTQTDPTLVSLKNLKVSAYSTSAYSSIFVTPQNLAISSTYRVSISNQIAGIDSGLPVRAPADQLSTCKPGSGFVYCFTFSTGPTNEPCLIDKVGIDPPSFVTQNLGTIVDAKQNRVYWSPVPYPVDHCQILDPSVYQWGWKPSQAVDSNFLIAAALNPTAATTLLDAKTPTKDGASIDITASTMQQGALKTGTGTLVINPGPPRIYEQCSIDGIRSPSPSIMWSAATPVCRTSLVSVTFNQPVVLLNADKTESPFTFSLFQCTGTKKDHECDTAVATATTDFTPTTMNADDNVYQYTIEPKAPLFLNTTYIAEVSTNTKGVGVNGKMMVPMKGCPVGVGYCFTFKTAATLIDNDAACKLASIELSPGNYTTTDYGTVQQLLNGSWTPLAWIAQGFGADKCVYLDPNAFTFNWGIDLAHAGYAAVDPDNKWSDTGWAQYIAAYKETGDSPLSILATAQNITGSSLLSVAFTNPHITSYDPLDCPGSTSGVCLNSLVDITFSTNINLDSLQNKLFLYECPATTNLTTDDCAFADSDLKNALVPTIDANDNHHVLFASQNFDPQRKYRLVLKGGVLSDAGLPFADFNYPATNAQYFTWTFITGTAACAIDHVNVKPVDAIAQAQGQVQQFLVGAFGQADACHPDGQPLNPNAYTWSWTSSVPLVAQETAASSTPDHAFSINANGPVVNGFQSTNITAQTMGKSDTVPWKLVCNASAISCPAGTQVGKDGCCYKQLGFDTVYPDPNATDICRNTLITAHVNELVDTTTVSSTSFMVGYATDAATCAGGDYRGGFCYKKLPYTVDVVNHTNSKADPSTSEALLTASVGDMLPANTQVKVMISKTNPTDAANADYSVLANSGVAVTGQSWTFTTGPNPCALNKVQIFPDQINFQKLNAPEEAIAYGLSHQGNRDVPLAAISGKYDWTWNWASQFVKVAKIDPIEKKTQQKTEMVAGGQNGKTFVTGLAKIVSDIYFDPSTKGHDVVGRLPVWAAICDTPWYSDAQTPLTDILNGQNMSFWYCETPTGQKPLPHLVPIIDPVADTSANAADVYTVLNAFHLTDPTTGAAVGFRIEKNLKNYSPLEWYYQKEFKGDVTPQVVAGLDAVRVANTLYVAYGNQSTNSSYTNMLIISLSDPATPELQAIFDQILANLQTSTNLVDDGLCYQGAEASTQQCNKDADCPTVPQTPLTPVQMASRVFVNTNELSGTGSDANLKSGIRCSITFDAAGSHFQAMVYDAAQKKISFQTDPVYAKIVADAQNVLPLDCNNSGPSGLCSTASTPGPISCYSSADCPSNGTCVMPATPTTCQIPYTKFIRDTNRVIDVATLTRSLEKAHAFANKYPVVATGSFVPGLTASTWPQWTDFMSQLGIAQVVDPLNSYAGCTGDFDTATCWNAKSQKYQCNPGSEAYHYRTINSGADYQLGISFEQDSSLTNNWAGYIKDTVLASGRVNLSFCTGNTYVADAVCGDGSIGGSEQCDPPGKTVTINDSTTYGSSTAVCTSQCKYGPQTPVTLCGDGIIQVGVETCDDGKALNGKYNHCPADCGVKSKVLVSSLGACGDGIIQPGVEMCEINSGVGAVTIGSKYAINQVDSCNWDCKAYGPYCGDGTVNADHGEDCDGDQTDYANSCVRKCNKHTDANPCKWTNATAGVPVCEKIQTTPGTPTTPPGCGDGKFTPGTGEECDNGTDPSNPATANSTKPYSVGGQNGIPCVPAYGQKNTCQYCTTSCKKAYVSGGYCGDGIKNGTEVCDKNDIGAGAAGPNGSYPAGTYQYGTQACKSDCSGFVEKGPAPSLGDILPVYSEFDSHWFSAHIFSLDDSNNVNGALFTHGQIATYGLSGQPTGLNVSNIPLKFASIGASSTIDKEPQPFIVGMRVGVRRLISTGCLPGVIDCPNVAAFGPGNVDYHFPGGVSHVPYKELWDIGYITAVKNGTYDVKYETYNGGDPTVTNGGTATGVLLNNLARIPDEYLSCGKQTNRLNGIHLSVYDPVHNSPPGLNLSPYVKLPSTSVVPVTFAFSDPTLPWLPVRLSGNIRYGDSNSAVVYDSQLKTENAFPILVMPTSTPSGEVNQTQTYSFDTGPLIGTVRACFSPDAAYRLTVSPQLRLYANGQTIESDITGGAFAYSIPQLVVSTNASVQHQDIEPNGLPGDYRVVVTGIESVTQTINGNPVSLETWGLHIGASVPGNEIYSGATPPAIYCNGKNGWSSAEMIDEIKVSATAIPSAIIAWRDGCLTKGPWWAQIDSAVGINDANAFIPKTRTLIGTIAASQSSQAYVVWLSRNSVLPAPIAAAKVAIWYRNVTPDANGHYWRLVSTFNTDNLKPDAANADQFHLFTMLRASDTDTSPETSLYAGQYVPGGVNTLLLK